MKTAADQAAAHVSFPFLGTIRKERRFEANVGFLFRNGSEKTNLSPGEHQGAVASDLPPSPALPAEKIGPGGGGKDVIPVEPGLDRRFHFAADLMKHGL